MGRTLTAVLVMVLAGVLAACGRSSSSGSGGDAMDVTEIRETMSALILAAGEGETGVAKVKDKLAAGEFMGLLAGSATKPFSQLSEDERNSAYQSCFNQLLAVPNTTNLKDLASINAALAAGRIDVRERTRGADVSFQGLPADGKGKPVSFKAILALGNDGKWRMISCEAQFGR